MDKLIQEIYKVCRYALVHVGDLCEPELDSIFRRWKREARKKSSSSDTLSVVLLGSDGTAIAVCQALVYKRTCAIIGSWGVDRDLQREIVGILTCAIIESGMSCGVKAELKDRKLFMDIGFEFPEIKRVKTSVGVLVASA